MRKTVLLAIVAGGALLNACTLPQMIKMAKKQELKANPNPLEVHKDTVAVELTAILPVKMIKPRTTYTLNTFYKFADKELKLDAVPFKSDDYPQSSSIHPKASRKISFPYQNGMGNDVLQVEGVAAKGTKSKSTPRLDVAVGLITTSRMVQNSYFAAFADHGYNNQEEIVPVIIPDFQFEQGKSTLRKSEIAGSTGKTLDAFIATKNLTRTVTITGTHSPEGRERVNTELSEERAKAIEKFYRDEMKKYDYQGAADGIRFILKPVVDDWNEFKTALSSYSGIGADEKAEYLNIINAGGTFPDVEKKLSGLTSYKKVFKEVYPALRSAKTEILTVKKKKTDAEIAVLAKQITQGQAAGSLTVEELMYAATLTPSLDEKAAIYTAATKMGTYWNAHNNLGAVYLTQAIQNPSSAKELAGKAAAQLELAARLRSTSEVKANMATLTLMQGNAWKAASYAAQALNGASNDVTRGVNGVKAACEIRMAKYPEAVASASSAVATTENLFNKGLAQLLNKEYANASSSFAEATRSNSGYAHAWYGAAVAAARQNNAEGVVSNLSKAVQADSSLKQNALNDLEFSKFNSSDAFRNVLK